MRMASVSPGASCVPQSAVCSAARVDACWWWSVLSTRFTDRAVEDLDLIGFELLGRAAPRAHPSCRPPARGTGASSGSSDRRAREVCATAARHARRRTAAARRLLGVKALRHVGLVAGRAAGRADAPVPRDAEIGFGDGQRCERGRPARRPARPWVRGCPWRLPFRAGRAGAGSDDIEPAPEARPHPPGRSPIRQARFRSRARSRRRTASGQ
jgi:hypothetical protein